MLYLLVRDIQYRKQTELKQHWFLRHKKVNQRIGNANPVTYQLLYLHIEHIGG